jgi:hypothetical protein
MLNWRFVEMRSYLNTAPVEDVVSVTLLNVSYLVNFAEVETGYIISRDCIFLETGVAIGGLIWV